MTHESSLLSPKISLLTANNRLLTSDPRDLCIESYEIRLLVPENSILTHESSRKSDGRRLLNPESS